jgi:hypothetical protein
MQHSASVNIFSAAALTLFLMAAPLTAQENSAPVTQPTKDQEQTPGLQQTPDGQTMNTAGEWIKPAACHSRVGSVALGGSTGPTFPNGPAWK